MAETQRRATRDQAELALKDKQITLDALDKNRQQQIDIALNASDNLTEERIKTAELSQDAAALRTEQEQTALTALQGARQSLGA